MSGLPAGVSARALIGLVAMLCVAPAAAQAPAPEARGDRITRTPIKHVLLIIGENRSFDHLLGLFRPGPGQSVWNLFSQQILNADGSPGANFARARQWQASGTGRYSIHPPKSAPFATLPPPGTDNAPTNPPFASVAAARAAEPALPGGCLPATDHRRHRAAEAGRRYPVSGGTRQRPLRHHPVDRL